MNYRKQVLFVDDDNILQKLLREYFSTRNFYLHKALSCHESTKKLSAKRIDIVILDILLPDQNGIQYLQWIKEKYPALPVLMLSSQKEEKDRIKGLEMGADDYLIKPFSLRELELRLEKLLTTSQPPKKENTFHRRFSFDSQQEFIVKNGTHIKLTYKETQILQMFFRKPDQVISRNDLSIELNGNDHRPLDRSIDVHMNHLRKKIEDNPAEPKILKTVWGKGYRFLMS